MKTTTLAVTAAGAILLGSAGVAAAGSSAKAADARLPIAHAQQLAAEDVGTATVRLSGADRYETAAEVSRSAWTPEDASVVYLASGENFPDALSAGASTQGLGPLLLTRPDVLPPATRAELERLAPCLVVVVGGDPAVSDAVALEADSYTDPAACA